MDIEAVNSVNSAGAYLQTQTEMEANNVAKGSVFGDGHKTKKEQQVPQKPLPKPVKPTKPVLTYKKPEIAGTMAYKVQYGDTASEIAEKYHITMAELQAANPGKKLGVLIAGDHAETIKVPYRNNNEWKAYKDAQAKFEKASAKYEKDIALYNKIIKANEVVTQLRNLNNNHSLEYSVDAASGEIKVIVKGQITLGEIKKALGITAKGGLLSANPQIKENYKPETRLGFKFGEGIRKEAQWDKVELNAGETLVIPADIIDVERASKWYQK